MPAKTREDLVWDIGTATYTVGTDRPTDVLVEWRSAKPVTAQFAIEQQDITRRRDAIIQLLHRTSTMAGAGDYRVLDTLGYVEFIGREDGRPVELAGFVSRYPSWADDQRRPVTLLSLLTKSFEADEPAAIPGLATRFGIARDIASAFYQLQCSNWLHRNLSSHQILFFYDRDQGAGELAEGPPRLDRPYLVGFQYSRPDDNPRPVEKDTDADSIRSRGNFSEGIDAGDRFPNIYLPSQFSTPEQRRYRRSDGWFSHCPLLPLAALLLSRHEINSCE